MGIISENQHVKADISLRSGCLDIKFHEDPAYARSETVLVDLLQGSIGIIFEHAYHHIGELPANVKGSELKNTARARLHGQGENGREIELHAPVKVIVQ